jgi:hypothetical protein
MMSVIASYAKGIDGDITMALNSPDDLRDLVDNPVERLEVEYKDWLDLASGNKPRADLARHVAALANHGGGHIVFGFDDKTRLPTGPNKFPYVSYTNDLISGIVKKYLEPTFQCIVRPVVTSSGNEHPIVDVPGHREVPICAKADGPQDLRGRPEGIVAGVYYIRKPGPESAPILTAAEWAPIIRRCVMHDKGALLASVDAALRGAVVPETEPEKLNLLRKWHFACRKLFLSVATANQGFFQFSYHIERADGETLDQGGLIRILHELNNEIRDTVNTGWSIFYPFDRREIAPFFATDPESGLDHLDFVQAVLPNDSRERDAHLDTWRFAGNGLATIVRDYWEDGPGLNQWMRASPGTWFSPNHLVMDLGEFVRHARACSERFSASTAVTFRCEWDGLLNRSLKDPSGRWSPGQGAKEDHRVATGSWPASSLRDTLPEIVSQLAAPVMRLFMPARPLTPEWVRADMAQWRPYHGQ